MANNLFNGVQNIDLSGATNILKDATVTVGSTTVKMPDIEIPKVSVDGTKIEITNKASSSSSTAEDTTKKKANEVISEATKKATEGIQSIDIAKQVQNQFNSHAVQDMVNDLIEKQIDEAVKEQVKKARQSYNTSSLGNAVATAEAYYGKILNSEKLLTDMRTDYTTSLNKAITADINKRLSSINIGGKWGKKLLAQSKIATSVTKFVTDETAKIINSVISSKAIATVSKDIVDTVNRLKTATMNQINTTFKSQIDYAKKLKKAAEDKIQAFNEAKQKYIQKMQAYVDKLKSAVMDQVKKIEQAAINEISKYIKINAGSIAGGISL